MMVKHYVDSSTKITVVKLPNVVKMVIEKGDDKVTAVYFYPESFYIFFIKLMKLVVNEED